MGGSHLNCALPQVHGGLQAAQADGGGLPRAQQLRRDGGACTTSASTPVKHSLPLHVSLACCHEHAAHMHGSSFIQQGSKTFYGADP